MPRNKKKKKEQMRALEAAVNPEHVAGLQAFLRHHEQYLNSEAPSLIQIFTQDGTFAVTFLTLHVLSK